MTKTRNKKEDILKKDSADSAAETAGEEPCETPAEEESDNRTETAEEEGSSEPGEPDAESDSKEEEGEQEEPMKDQYLRLMADFQNYKRRVAKEREDTRAYANEKIVTELLTVLDNFDRAMEHDADEGFKEGMQMILDQFNEVLKHAGVEEIEAEKAEFDPNLHNAVMMEETDEVESGHVSCVLQKGYKLNGKVIRPSMVKVAN